LIVYPEIIESMLALLQKVNRVRVNVAWVIRIKQGIFNYCATFYNEEEAYTNISNINVRENLEIKNLLTVFENHVVVQLTHGRAFTCDPEDLHIVEDHVWCVNGNGYVTTHIDGSNCSFHNIVMGHHITIDILLLIILTETL